MEPTNVIQTTSEITVEEIGGYGGDWLVVDAARVSTRGTAGSGPREVTKPDEIGLIKALLRQRHKAPFQHGGITLFVEAPIFVFREWRTHRIAMVQTTDNFAYSESSARYRPLRPKFYLPPEDRKLILPEKHNRMKPEYVSASTLEYQSLTETMIEGYMHSWQQYQELLAAGVAPEMARAVLPVGIYSAMYVSANPLSWIHFLSLRTHDERSTFISYPQWEIEVAARVGESIFAKGWPVTYAAWNEAGRIS